MMLRKLNAYKHRTDHQHSTLIDARQLQALTKDSRLTRAEIPKTPTWACPSEFGDIAMCPRHVGDMSPTSATKIQHEEKMLDSI
mmetsp:Transcript_33485/g.50326  ORF Transcript_33485/g.50326 Transcript_33485/m.50326 type:complete len:84 (-) Transcript_33485:525-776(-)